jgi:anti-sigma28 factor (negative regulator of flagellin synthesis)
LKKVTNADGIRTDLIKKFRKQINEKKYEVKSDEIASKMANELFNVKNSTMLIRLKV